MLVNQDESITFTFNTYDPDTGDSKDADSTPSATVYDAAGVAVAQVVAIANITTGLYSAILTAVNVDFDIGKEYIVVAEATVTGSGAGATPITAKATIGQFQVSGVNHGKDLVNLLDGYTPRQALAFCASVLAGRIADAGDPTETYRDLANTVDRVVAAVDQTTGDRTNVTFDITGLN